MNGKAKLLIAGVTLALVAGVFYAGISERLVRAF